MNPGAPVTGVDERAQLTAAAHDLVASAVRTGRPLDRELHILGDHVQGRIRVRSVKRREIAFEKAHGRLALRR
jgi:hypothetical protein